jgi:hypothetical protein
MSPVAWRESGAGALDLYLVDPPERPDICAGCGTEAEPFTLAVDDNLDPRCDDCWETE